jgi:uncharacterized protein YukE
MTDFAALSPGSMSFSPDSAWNPAAVLQFRSDDRRRSARAPAAGRSASSLASAVHQLLDAIRDRRVPAIESLRERLQQLEGRWAVRELAHALRALHDATGGIDFLATRGGERHAQVFRDQGDAVGAAARRLGNASAAFAGRQASDAAVARLLWLELQHEYRGLEKRVHRGLEWVVEMEDALQAGQAGASAEVSQRAAQQLVRRAQALEDRLHHARGLCGAARAARSLGAQVAAQRGALGNALQEKVRPRTLALQQTLQPLLEAAGRRPLEAAELLAAIDARHRLQVALTEAGAELIQLEALQHELATQLAWIERKARLAVSGTPAA